MKKSRKKKWKSFEEMAYQIQKELSPKAKVVLNDHILGVESGKKRQIDISVREHVGQFEILIVLECRALGTPVDLPEVEAFVQKVRDVRANKGAVVSWKGFTDGALRLAKNYCIDTFRPVDTESTDWKAYATIPALLIRHFIGSFSFIFTNFVRIPIALADTRVLMDSFGLDRNRQKIGKIRHLIAKEWNSNKIPPEAGRHYVSLSECRFVEHEGEIFQGSLTVNVDVVRRRYLGPWSVEKVKGFSNVRDGGLITTELITSSLEPYLIETGQVSGWVSLEDDQKPSIQPILTLNYQDHLPENEEEERIPPPTKESKF